MSGFKEGDRVVSETAAEICGECMLCRTGRYNLCPFSQGIRLRRRRRDGAVRDACRRGVCTTIPDTLPFELACLAEPHAVAYNAMCVNSTIRPGDLVVVLGPGPIGLLCARMAALAGADPLIVVGLPGDAARLETGARLGAARTVDIADRKTEEVVRGCRSAGGRPGLRCDGRQPAVRGRAADRAAGRAGRRRSAGRPICSRSISTRSF